MKKTRIVALAAVAALAVTAPASATERIVTLDVAMAPGIAAPQIVDYKVSERQYRLDRRCRPFEHVRVRYTGVRRDRGVSCAQVRRYVKLHAPQAYVCDAFPLALDFVGQAWIPDPEQPEGAAGERGKYVTTYTSGKARIVCYRRSPGAFAFTARDLDR